MIRLDKRLALAASLFRPCETGADIGCDHALLPCHLLEQGVCQRMLLCDISPSALRHGEERVRRMGLSERVLFRVADGLDALEEQAGCISITGMGGRTIADILRRGSERLHGASLVLCAHTEQPEARAAVEGIGYRFVREEPCLCADRTYIVWLAEPGDMCLNPVETRCGTLLFQSDSEDLLPYLDARISVLEQRLKGMQKAREVREETISELLEDLDYMRMKQTAIQQRTISQKPEGGTV